MKRTLKQVTVEEVQEAMSKALTDLLGTEHKVAIVKLDFSAYERMGGSALIPIDLTVHEVLGQFLGAI